MTIVYYSCGSKILANSQCLLGIIQIFFRMRHKEINETIMRPAMETEKNRSDWIEAALFIIFLVLFCRCQFFFCRHRSKLWTWKSSDTSRSIRLVSKHKIRIQSRQCSLHTKMIGIDQTNATCNDVSVVRTEIRAPLSVPSHASS